MKSQFTNLYVENVDPEMSQDEFEKLFTTHGTLISALIQVDDQGKSKGFGFVKDENHKDAQKAVDALHDSGHYGKKLFVKMEKLSKYQGVNLHIKNLEDDVVRRCSRPIGDADVRYAVSQTGRRAFWDESGRACICGRLHS
ncbi:hypothetical protein B0H15DRAFT_954682 [Mycena belliarum]|uniref:RRM domain-containing protein n=1 Tax=Mycena belliarum TaxID=1033014 RepID=A0AAD6TXU1_9AGAR|nr:hypothetical protein B0H15DRAFT_954682 [Mycena belliae]